MLVTCPCLTGSGAQEAAALREPVHPRRNVEDFAPVEAKYVRFTVERTVRGEVCFDELEIYGPDAPSRNLALADSGTRARASGSLPEYRIHNLHNINDGLYGNGHSWISDTAGPSWVELELPAPARISRIVWGRDREGKFTDRLALDYRIETALAPGEWREVASSRTRAPLELVMAENPTYASSLTRIPPAVTDLAGSARPASREYVIETWQTSRGLPANTVTSVVQSRDGWLWIGTLNGIARFDGRTFRSYGETSGLPGLAVTCLLEDAQGVLWAGTEGSGLARWDGTRFHALPTGNNREGNTVLTLGEDAQGTLWVGTRGGTLRLSGGKPVPQNDITVSRMVRDAADGVWFVVNSALWHWDGRQMSSMEENGDRSQFSSLSALARGPDGSLWFGGANGFIGRMQEGSSGATTTYGEGHALLASSVWELLPARSGDVWLGTSASGVGRLRDGKILHLTTDDGLPANSIRALCEDREGNIWVGTSGGGLTRLSPRRIQALTTHDGLSHNAVMALAESAGGNVWIGTNGGGLNRWHAGKVAPHAPSYVLENKSIAALVSEPDGSLWLGTSESGLFHLTDNGVDYWGKKDGLPGRTAAALCEDPAGGLWVGTLDGGPAHWQDGVATVPEALAPMAGQPVTCLLADAPGSVWLGTAGQGLARLKDGTLTRWTRGDGLASDFVRTIRADAAGGVWIGTNGGLTRWTGGRLHTFSTAEGLPDTFISQILEDESGHLWLGTNRGVLRIALASFDAVAAGRAPQLEVLALGTGDGLPGSECTGGYHPAGLRLQDGRLCFGTVGGLAVIDPARFATADAAPPVVLENVSPGGTVQQLPPEAGRVEFAFTALHFTAPERVRFRYRMSGLDAAWSAPSPDRTATYTHLPPGEFRFEVTATADGSTWSAPASLTIRVPAPWWKSPWCYALAALLSLAAVAGTVRMVTRRRMQRRLRAAEQNLALERERTRIARDIHDDLGATLTQISLLSAVGQERRAEPQVAGEQFSAINAAAGELVQSLDAIVWAVNPRHDTLESLARYITRFAGDLCARSPVRLRLNVPPELPDIPLTSEVRHNVFLACKEALNNALRHAAPAELRISIAAAADHFTITVEDDGCGFTPGHDTGGDGLDNMRRRLADCGGRCEITSAPGRGTSVGLTLPLAAPAASA